jgi:periplasmic protein CpxP/Spy
MRSESPLGKNRKNKEERKQDIMKAMNFAVALLAATLMTGAGFAQTATTGTGQTTAQTPDQQTAPPQHKHKHQMPTPEERLQHMTKKLNLTADQQAKIKPILEQEQQQMQTIHNDTSLSKEDRQAKFREAHKNYEGQIRAVLNPDQQTKFDQMAQKHKERMEKHQQQEAKPAS